MTHDAIRPLRLAYIIGTYPLLTTTFVDREVMLLRQRGVTLDIYSIRRPHGNLSAEQQQLQREVTYLLPPDLARLLWAHLFFLLREPRALLGTFYFLLTRPHPSFKSRLMTVLHFGEGVYAAYLLRQKRPQRLHAHFVDRATTVALVAARLLHLPYSATAHANDIYVQPVLLPEKITAASFIATCTGYNQAYLQHIAAVHTANGRSHKEIIRVYHGLDIHNYQPQHRQELEGPFQLLAVGQLKEKKGYPYLLRACRLLKEQGYNFHCTIVGGGPLHNALQSQIDRDDLATTVTLCGALPHDAVIDHFRRATVFALPCILAADGDRDGIPNVILEAMALERPVVSTSHSGIPEVITDGCNGLLVEPEDEQALARAIATLFDDPDLRRTLGQKGRKTVLEKFSVEANVDQLLREFLA